MLQNVRFVLCFLPEIRRCYFTSYLTLMIIGSERLTKAARSIRNPLRIRRVCLLREKTQSSQCLATRHINTKSRVTSTSM